MFERDIAKTLDLYLQLAILLQAVVYVFPLIRGKNSGLREKMDI
jgi:hypothetical protein